jgi:hypothetical protein
MTAKIWNRRRARQQADAHVCAEASGWMEQVIAATKHTAQVLTLPAAEPSVPSAEAEVA